MNLDVVQPRNKTEGLIFLKTKNCAKFFKKTHTKPQENIDFKLTQRKETFSFKHSIDLGLDFT